jgi:MinD-like ATPase involved in chromosome partitioning or flagellar assembly
MPISCVIPLDKEISTAVNRGVPVTVSASRSPAAKAIRELAEELLPKASAAEAKAAAEGKAHKQNAPKLPSPGRQSILTRFSKTKDKKAA